MLFNIPERLRLAAGIYAISNLENGRRYIGSGLSFATRYQTHLSTLKHAKHRNRPLQEDFTKAAGVGFSFDLIEVISDTTQLLRVEQSHLDRLFADRETCYNLSKKASSSVRQAPRGGEVEVFVNPKGEVWRSVANFVAYEVSNLGRVRSYHIPGKARRLRSTPTIRKATPAKKRGGYMIVVLRKDGKSYARSVHHLVLEAFQGACPPGMQARHLNDRDVTNNTLENLKWGTAKENIADKIRHGTSQHGERNPMCKLSDVDVATIRASTLPGCVLAKQYGVRDPQISRIRNGVRRAPPIL